MTTNPLVTMDAYGSATLHDGSAPRLASQFRAFSMMNLGSKEEQFPGMLSHLEYESCL